jgi:hypothetical protein
MPLVRMVNAPGLLLKVQLAIVGSQRELGLRLGMSRRTVSRWMTGQGGPSIPQWAQLAREVYPVNPALAETICVEMGETLVTLGLVAPAVPQPAVPARPVIPVGDLVDSIVCAAAEAASTTPQTMRPAILAALDRTVSVQLTIDEVRAALRPAAGRSPAGEAKKRRPS